MPLRKMLMFVAGILIVLTACTSSKTSTSTKQYSPIEILNFAKAAKLNDATFSFSRYMFQDVSDPSYIFTFTGNGILTTNPHLEREHVSMDVDGTQIEYDEIIGDNNLVYIKMPTLDWYVQGSNENDALIWSTGVLNYDQMQDPTLVKSDEMLNGVKTWHITSDVALPVGSTGTLTDQIWIREDNHFPLQSILTFRGAQAAGNNAGMTSPGGDYNIKVLFTEWNTNITIDVPYI